MPLHKTMLYMLNSISPIVLCIITAALIYNCETNIARYVNKVIVRFNKITWLPPCLWDQHMLQCVLCEAQLIVIKCTLQLLLLVIYLWIAQIMTRPVYYTACKNYNLLWKQLTLQPSHFSTHMYYCAKMHVIRFW